jgi:hypothetical protein
MLNRLLLVFVANTVLYITVRVEECLQTHHSQCALCVSCGCMSFRVKVAVRVVSCRAVRPIGNASTSALILTMTFLTLAHEYYIMRRLY